MMVNLLDGYWEYLGNVSLAYNYFNLEDGISLSILSSEKIFWESFHNDAA